MSKEEAHNQETRRERLRKALRFRKAKLNQLPMFDTSDVIQDASIQLWTEGIDSFDCEYSSVDQALIATIANGHLAKHYRRYSTQKRNASRNQSIEDDVESGEPDPIDEMVRAEDMSRLIAAINQLEGESYVAIHRHCILGLTLKQMAEEESLSIAKIRTRISRAKRELRKLLSSQPPPSQNND